MKPDWDKLMGDFTGSKTALVSDVDCTSDGGKGLCEKIGVSGYPTLKHGDPNALTDYSGGRTYDDLKKFADENLGPSCGPEHLDLCSDEDKAAIEKFQKMDDAELTKALADADAQIKNAQTKGEKAVAKIEEKIKEVTKKLEDETKKKDAAIAKEKKKLGLGMMKAVLAAKKKSDSADAPGRKGKGKKEL